MVLQLDRLRYERALEVMLGVLAGTTPARLGDEWFDAMAYNEADIDRLRWDTNMARAAAQAANKRAR